jgi:5,6-dimethylbenzimidazole synthase
MNRSVASSTTSFAGDATSAGSDPIRFPRPSSTGSSRRPRSRPRSGTSQPWRFVKVGSPERRDRIRESFRACSREALAGYGGERARRYAALKLSGLDVAPVQLAVFVDPDPEAGAGLGRRTMPETVPYSAVLAIHTLWLAARARGIGLGWVSILDPGEVRGILDIDEAWSLVAYLCLGLPEEEHLDPELERAGWQGRLAASELVVERLNLWARRPADG